MFHCDIEVYNSNFYVAMTKLVVAYIYKIVLSTPTTMYFILYFDLNYSTQYK